MAKIELRVNAAGLGSLVVDGTDLSREIGDMQLSCVPGRKSELQIRLPGVEAAVEADALVRLPPGTEAVLVALGWTPPATETPVKR